jgi:hypothetical protein
MEVIYKPDAVNRGGEIDFFKGGRQHYDGRQRKIHCSFGHSVHHGAPAGVRQVQSPRRFHLKPKVQYDLMQYTPVVKNSICENGTNYM